MELQTRVLGWRRNSRVGAPGGGLSRIRNGSVQGAGVMTLTPALKGSEGRAEAGSSLVPKAPPCPKERHQGAMEGRANRTEAGAAGTVRGEGRWAEDPTLAAPALGELEAAGGP